MVCDKNSLIEIHLNQLQLIYDLGNNLLINMKPFEKFFKKSTLKKITHHSSEYMKFNIWLGFLGWFAKI